jgi:hypothetical protein
MVCSARAGRCTPVAMELSFEQESIVKGIPLDQVVFLVLEREVLLVIKK